MTTKFTYVAFLILCLVFAQVHQQSISHAAVQQVPVAETVTVQPSDDLRITRYIRQVNTTLSERDAEKFAQQIQFAAKTFDLEVQLLLALITIESRFKPEALNAGAKGLMQVIPKWHGHRIAKARKVVDAYSIYEPRLNLYVGASALREYIDETGDLHTGLLRYNGSVSDPQKTYARLVLAEAAKVRRMLKL